MSTEKKQLINAIAAAIAGALAAHGVKPADGNKTLREACEALCRSWGGETHWIPKIYRTEREARIASGLAEGQPIKEVAKSVGVHCDTVRRISKRPTSGLGRDDWVI